MAKTFAVVRKILVVAAWGILFSLMFRWAVVPALLQNLSPSVVLSAGRRSLPWLLLLSLPLVLLAALRGRFFCWHVCPVGLLQDLLPSRGRARASPHNRGVFLFLIGFAVLSLNLLVFFDPLVIFNRAVSAAGMNISRAKILYLPLLAVLALSLWRRRFWCFRLCPLGAFFDWVIWLRAHRGRGWLPGPGCPACPGNDNINMKIAVPIQSNLDRPDSPRSDGTVGTPTTPADGPLARPLWEGRPAPIPAGQDRPDSPRSDGTVGTPIVHADRGRRNFLLLLGGGLAGGLALRHLNRRGGKIDPRIIRPPGALPEDEFSERCVRCGGCLAVCLTGGLQPTLSGAGWAGFLTPRLVPRIGECDEFCNRCGQSCPTQAIRAMPLGVKRRAKLGTARVAKERCLAWAGDKHCLVCQEFCPYLAIRTAKNATGVDSPEVVADRCRGCGICEKNCRSDPRPAIIVYNDGAGTLASESFGGNAAISDP